VHSCAGMHHPGTSNYQVILIIKLPKLKTCMNYDYVIKKTVQRVLQFIPQLLQVQDNNTLACLEYLNI